MKKEVLRNFKVADRHKVKTMQLLNIVLLHNQSPESYIDLFKKMVYFDHVIKLRGEHYIELLRFERLATLNMYECTIVSYMGIRQNAWFNQKSKTIESIDGDEDLYANTKKATFYFIPEVHKLCLMSGSEITIQNIKKYIDEASKMILGSGQVHSNFVTSKDEITEACKELNINRVKLTFNYSNKDITEGFEETFDNLTKNDNISLINMEIQSAEDEDLNLNKGGMVDSLINLVTKKGNGDAEIIGYELIPGKRKGSKFKRKNHKIRTADYIEKIKIGFDSIGSMYTTIFNEVVTRFKRTK
mgnify:FL=1